MWMALKFMVERVHIALLKNSTRTKLYISQDNGCNHKTGIQNYAHAMTKFDKIVDIAARSIIWSKQKSIFSTNNYV